MVFFFFVQRASLSFWAFLAGCCSHSSGVLPALIVSFSSFVLRCLGTDTIADQVLSPIVREIVEALYDLELQDRVIGLAAGIALALLGLRLRHGLDVSTEILPWHDLLDRFQRIAQSANGLQPAPNIEKALLPHDPLAPSAHDRARSPSQIRGDLARGIFRGALLFLMRHGGFRQDAS